MIFVTGGNGLLGSHLLYYLVSHGEKVKALVRNKKRISGAFNTFAFYSEDPQKLIDQIQWVEGDITDFTSLEEYLEGITKVYHTAALVSFNNRLNKLVLETNVKGTANLVNICLEKKIEKFCHISSIGALGETETGSLITENTFWKPTKKISTYSLSKYYAEMEVWRGITEGLNAVILNPSVILGPGDWSKGSPAFFRFASKGYSYYTDGVTGYVDVNDVVIAMVSAMEQNISGERYIISSENLSYKEILTIVATQFNNNLPVKKVPTYFLKLFQKAEYLRSLIFNTEPVLTKDLVRILESKSLYDNSKSIQHLNMLYTPISQSISNTLRIYKNQRVLNNWI